MLFRSALARERRFDEAAGQLREALRLDPGNQAAAQLLDRITAAPTSPAP